MNRQERNNEEENNTGSGNWNWRAIGAGTVIVGGLAAAAAIYFSNSASVAPSEEATSVVEEKKKTKESEPRSLVSRAFNFLETMSPTADDEKIGILRSAVPIRPVLSNTNALLSDIYVRYVALESEDCTLYYQVFSEVFRKVQKAMKAVDPYYNKYSSKKQFAGSHFDHLRIKKPSEYDMDIVIGLPLNYHYDAFQPDNSDLIIEHLGPGFVRLRTGTQFKNLYKRDGTEILINKTAYEWADDKGFLLGTKFKSWFKSVVDRALNSSEFEFISDQKRGLSVNGIRYTIRLSNSGPAITIFIEGSKGFRLDVDFVPALSFPESRWLGIKQYKSIPPSCQAGDFMVVPKQDQSFSEIYRQRSWRLALQDQEKKLMYDKKHMKQVIRLMKKYRDTQNMKGIASYYIKTLFFWEIENQPNPRFWSENDIHYLFKYMMERLKEAMVNGEIPYFWNRKNNLINFRPETSAQYARNIEKVLAIIDDRQRFKDLAKFLLTSAELQSYQSILY